MSIPSLKVADRTFPVDNFSSHHPDHLVYFEAEDLVSHDGRKWLVVRAGDTFHLRLAKTTHPKGYVPSAGKAHGSAYRPIHPSMTAEDIEGATFAHDDGSAWLFAHCSPGEQIDFAAEAEAYAVAQFAESIQRSLSVGALSNTNIGRSTSHAKTDALIRFARMVGRRVHKAVVGATLGHFHRDPHRDHKRDLTVAAIRHELGVLQQNQAADDAARAKLGRVQEAATAVVALLASPHTIEWRHERVARIQLEDIKKAIRGTDPVGGFEYVFTASATAAPPTAAADLPDGAWAADHAALANGVTRGAFIYHDGYPIQTGAEKPYVLSFKRATGGSEWTFVLATKVYGGTES